MHLKLMINVFSEFYGRFKHDEKEILIEFLELVCDKYRKNPVKLLDFLNVDEVEPCPKIENVKPDFNDYPILNSFLKNEISQRSESEITSSTEACIPRSFHTTTTVVSNAMGSSSSSTSSSSSNNSQHQASPSLSRRPVTGIMVTKTANSQNPPLRTPQRLHSRKLNTNWHRSNQQVNSWPGQMNHSRQPPSSNSAGFETNDSDYDLADVNSENGMDEHQESGQFDNGDGFDNRKYNDAASGELNDTDYQRMEEEDWNDEDFDEDEGDFEDYNNMTQNSPAMHLNGIGMGGAQIRSNNIINQQSKQAIEPFKTYLENIFEKEKYLSKTRFDDVCAETNLSKKQVRIWFKNKRFKLSYNAKNNITSKDKKFSSLVRNTLEEVYQRNNFPTPEEKKDLTIQLNLTISQIKDWFYRRRRCKLGSF